MKPMIPSLRWIAVLAIALSPGSAMATSLSFQNLGVADYEKVVKEFSSNFAYSTITPASSLGGLWGFEFGVIGGTTNATNTYNLVKTASPTSTWKKWLPHAGALLRVGLPYGLTVETVIFPKITVSNVKFQNYGGSLMWTLSDVLMEEPYVNIATKFYLTKASIAYSQSAINSTTGSTVNANIEFSDKIWGLILLVSKKISVIEPYLGLGYVKANGKLTVTGSAAGGTLDLFAAGTTFRATNSAESKPKATQLLAGLDFRLAFFSLGGEYQRSFGTSSLTGRLSFRF